jgi:hypothetical protein
VRVSQHDDIRLFADLQRSDPICHTDGPCSVEVSHFYNLRRQRAVGSVVATFCILATVSISPKRSRLLLLAQPSVPRPDDDSPFAHGFHRSNAGPQFHVAFRAVGHGTSPVAMIFHFFSSTQTQCAITVPLSRMPNRSRCVTGLTPFSRKDWSRSKPGFCSVDLKGLVPFHGAADLAAFSVSSLQVYGAWQKIEGVYQWIPFQPFVRDSWLRGRYFVLGPARRVPEKSMTPWASTARIPVSATARATCSSKK